MKQTQYRNLRFDIVKQMEDFLLGIDRQKFSSEASQVKSAVDELKHSQTVMFSDEQANVFLKISKDYTDGLDYRLPFSLVFIQFSRLLPTSVHSGMLGLIGIVLNQHEIDDQARKPLVIFDKDDESFNKALGEIDGALFLNTAIAIGRNNNGHLVTAPYSWFAGERMYFQGNTGHDADCIIALSIACIGYINCENIYLHREGEIAESVNAKRERNGKSRLEPYYVCRIRGVQYDKADPTGAGSPHGIRYDVRGHFRRLTTGKTTWVRPHQRGLANELYVPKVYLVDKREQP